MKNTGRRMYATTKSTALNGVRKEVYPWKSARKMLAQKANQLPQGHQRVRKRSCLGSWFCAFIAARKRMWQIAMDPQLEEKDEDRDVTSATCCQQLAETGYEKVTHTRNVQTPERLMMMVKALEDPLPRLSKQKREQIFEVTSAGIGTLPFFDVQARNLGA